METETKTIETKLPNGIEASIRVLPLEHIILVVVVIAVVFFFVGAGAGFILGALLVH